MKAAIMTATGASLALADHPSCDAVTIKKYLMGYIYDLHQPASHLIHLFLLGLLKLNLALLLD